MTHSNALRSLLLAALVALPSVTLGQSDAVIERTIRPGDSLSKIAKEFLGDAQAWPLLLRYNNVADPDRIEPGDRILIPVAMRDATTASIKVLGRLPFKAELQRPDLPVLVLNPGDTVPATGRVNVQQGELQIELPDQSVVRLSAGTELDLTEILVDPGSGFVANVLSLVRGYANVVVQAAWPGDRLFEIRARSMVAGVRGTEFDMGINGDTAILGVYEGQILAFADGVSTPVPAGQGVSLSDGGTLARVELPKPPEILAPLGVVAGDPLKLDIVPEPGVARYFIRIADDSAMTSLRFRGTKRNARSELPIDRVPSGDYYLTVQAEDENGFRSIVTGPHKFTVR